MKTKTDKKYEAWLATKTEEKSEERRGDNQRVPPLPPPPKTDAEFELASPEPEEIDSTMEAIAAEWGCDRELAKIYATVRIYFPGAKITNVRKKATPQSGVEVGTVD